MLMMEIAMAMVAASFIIVPITLAVFARPDVD